MKILVCGDRNWTDELYIERVLTKYAELPEEVTVVEGEARGADKLSRKVAERLGMEVEPYPAQWDRYGRGAGPVRNKEMLSVENPDKILAFHDNIDQSKGTKHMIDIAKKAGKRIILYTHKGVEIINAGDQQPSLP